MSEAQYSDPRLVALYDLLSAGNEDFAFYASRLPPPPLRVLDLGCGTGRFAVDLALKGYSVTGVDPAPAMLRFARKRTEASQVRWIAGTSSAVRNDRFDTVIMTGHAFQCLLTDDDIRATLADVRACLVPGGALMFETRNPNAEAWRSWNPVESRRRVTSSEYGDVDVFHDVISVDGERVTFQTYHQFAQTNDTIVNTSTLRFIDRNALEEHLRASGFAKIEWFGNWDGSAWMADSCEIIVIAR